ASSSDDNTARIYHVKTGETRVLHGHSDHVRFVAFSPDSSRLASASDDGTVRLWTRFGVTRVFHGHDGAVRHVSFSPDGKWIASIGDDRAVRLWKVDSSLEAPEEPTRLRTWLSTLTTATIDFLAGRAVTGTSAP